MLSRPSRHPSLKISAKGTRLRNYHAGFGCIVDAVGSSLCLYLALIRTHPLEQTSFALVGDGMTLVGRQVAAQCPQLPRLAVNPGGAEWGGGCQRRTMPDDRPGSPNHRPVT